MFRRKQADAGLPAVDEELLAEMDAALADTEVAAAEPAPEEAFAEEAPEEEVSEARFSRRYTARGRRKGRYRFAAPLGLGIMLLSLAGVVAIVLGIAGTVSRARDTTQLREQLDEFLYPLARYAPEPFDSVGESRQDALLQAAIHVVVGPLLPTQGEGGLAEGGDYERDEYGRLIVPVKDIDKAYTALFGNTAKPAYHTIGGDEQEEGGEDVGSTVMEWSTTRYDRENAVYHVPLSVDTQSTYYPKVASVTKKKGAVYVRMAYVLASDVRRDNRDNLVIDPQKAKYFQEYTLQETAAGTYIVTRIRNLP